jgi:hypothetical protein
LEEKLNDKIAEIEGRSVSQKQELVKYNEYDRFVKLLKDSNVKGYRNFESDFKKVYNTVIQMSSDTEGAKFLVRLDIYNNFFGTKAGVTVYNGEDVDRALFFLANVEKLPASVKEKTKEFLKSFTSGVTGASANIQTAIEFVSSKDPAKLKADIDALDTTSRAILEGRSASWQAFLEDIPKVNIQLFQSELQKLQKLQENFKRRVERKLVEQNISRPLSFTKQTFNKEDPIVIVGAGPVGLYMCYLLVKSGFKNITLIEKRNLSPAGWFTSENTGPSEFNSRDQQLLIEQKWFNTFPDEVKTNLMKYGCKRFRPNLLYKNYCYIGDMTANMAYSVRTRVLQNVFYEWLKKEAFVKILFGATISEIGKNTVIVVESKIELPPITYKFLLLSSGGIDLTLKFGGDDFKTTAVPAVEMQYGMAINMIFNKKLDVLTNFGKDPPATIKKQNRFRFFREQDKYLYLGINISEKEFETQQETLGGPRNTIKLDDSLLSRDDSDPLKNTFIYIVRVVSAFLGLDSNEVGPNLSIEVGELSLFPITLKTTTAVGEPSSGVKIFSIGDQAINSHFFTGTGVNVGFDSATLATEVIKGITGTAEYTTFIETKVIEATTNMNAVKLDYTKFVCTPDEYKQFDEENPGFKILPLLEKCLIMGTGTAPIPGPTGTPLTPIVITAETTDTTVTLSWTGADGAVFSLRPRDPSITSPYTITGLTPDTEYTYKITGNRGSENVVAEITVKTKASPLGIPDAGTETDKKAICLMNRDKEFLWNKIKYTRKTNEKQTGDDCIVKFTAESPDGTEYDVTINDTSLLIESFIEKPKIKGPDTFDISDLQEPDLFIQQYVATNNIKLLDVPKYETADKNYNLKSFFKENSQKVFEKWEVVDTNGDGNCLTHAFLQSLSPTYGRIENTADKNNVAIAFRLEFAKTDLARNKALYNSAGGTDWLTDNEISDYSRLFNVIVITFDQANQQRGVPGIQAIKPMKQTDIKDNTKVIFIYASGNHYSSIRDENGNFYKDYFFAKDVGGLILPLTDIPGPDPASRSGPADLQKQIQTAVDTIKTQTNKGDYKTRSNHFIKQATKALSDPKTTGLDKIFLQEKIAELKTLYRTKFGEEYDPVVPPKPTVPPLPPKDEGPLKLDFPAGRPKPAGYFSDPDKWLRTLQAQVNTFNRAYNTNLVYTNDGLKTINEIIKILNGNGYPSSATQLDDTDFSASVRNRLQQKLDTRIAGINLAFTILYDDLVNKRRGGNHETRRHRVRGMPKRAKTRRMY